MISVDRTSPLPLWAQVLADLRSRLRNGEFDQRFPTDQELTEQYAVSRHTAREAVRRLHEEGLLERQRGVGTVVRANRIDQPLGAIYSLFRSVEDQGYEQRSVVRALEQRTDPHAAAFLELGEHAPLVYLERVRLADGQPIALDRSWLPAELAHPLMEVDFSHTALYEELGRCCGVRPNEGWERIRPALPLPDEQRLLKISAHQPVFVIERLARDRSQPVEWRTSLVRGDRFAFVARWSPAHRYATALTVGDNPHHPHPLNTPHRDSP